jgi:phage shock protein A
MRTFVIALGLLLAAPALAQQPSPPSATELAIQIDTAVNQLAQGALNIQRQLIAAQQQIATLNKQLGDLKAKKTKPNFTPRPSKPISKP